MQIKRWIEHRRTPGTLADVARRILENDSKYRDVERTLLSMYILEARIRHGSIPNTAEAIGVSTMTIKRVMRSMNIRTPEIRRIARQIKRSNANHPSA